MVEMEIEHRKNGVVRGGRLPYQKKMRDDIRANMTAGRLLEGVPRYESVRRWHREFSKKTGSLETQELYSLSLARFVFHMELGPDELFAKAIEKGYEIGKITWAENVVDDFFNYMEQELAYKRKSCTCAYGALRGFFRSNGVLFIKKTPRQWAENRIQPPSKDDLVAIRKIAGIRGVTAIDIANSLGWRRSDIVCLTYKQVKKDFEEERQRLYVTFKSQKEEIWAANFLGLEATDSLRTYLAQREANGEEITDATPLIGQELDPSKAMNPDQFTRFIGKLGKNAGKHLTPTHFRKRFRTIAEAIIGGNPTKRMGGWKLEGVGEMYFLPPREESLKSYKQIEPAMSLTEQTFATENTALETLRTIAKQMGIDPMKLKISREISVDDATAFLTSEIAEAQNDDRLVIRTLRARLKELGE